MLLQDLLFLNCLALFVYHLTLFIKAAFFRFSLPADSGGHVEGVKDELLLLLQLPISGEVERVPLRVEQRGVGRTLELALEAPPPEGRSQLRKAEVVWGRVGGSK